MGNTAHGICQSQTGWPNRKIRNVQSYAIAMQFGNDFWVNWVFDLWKINQITTKRNPISNLELHNMHKVCTTLPWVHDQKQCKRKVSKTETDKRKRQASSLPHSKLCHSWSINHLDPIKRIRDKTNVIAIGNLWLLT